MSSSALFGHGIVSGNVIKRENEVLKLLGSSNKLTAYAPWMCLFSIIIFTLWCFIWSQYQDANTLCLNVDHSHQMCSITSIDFDHELFQNVSLITSGVLLSSFTFQILQMFEADILRSFRFTSVYCTAVINIIAAIAHFSMAQGWFPVRISIFGRVNHVARWGEWVSLVPLLMVMMNSIDVRNESDSRLMIEAALCQLISVFFGGIASLSSDFYLSMVLMVISCVLYMHLYYVLWRALSRYNRLLAISKHQQVAESTINDRKKDNVSTKHVVNQIELITATISVKLVITCTITWTIKIVVYGLGVMKIISQTHEAVIQSAMDCMSKSLYARVLCTSHGAAMSPEGLLHKILLIEEQANATIRQFLRFIYHELATPLNAVTISVQNLTDEALTPDGRELLDMAKDGCVQINDTLTNLLNLQELEEGMLVLHAQPFNLKALIHDVAGQYINIAREKDVNLLLAVDSRIPDTMLGEKIRLKQVMTILIANGIQFAEVNGTCAIMAELRNDIADDKTKAQVRVAVRDDGPGFNCDELQQLMKAYSQLTPGDTQRNLGIGLCVAKQVVELHGGSFAIDSAPNRGSSFYFDINFSLPRDSVINQDALIATAESFTINHLLPIMSEVTDYGEHVRMRSLTSRQQHDDGIILTTTDPLHIALAHPDTSLSSSTTSSATTPADHHTNSSTPVIGSYSGTRRLALVVDDAESNRKVLKKTLERLGFTADVCDDGDVLVDKIVRDRENYDVIFLDNMMPRMRGVEAIRILRSENYHGLVIGVTGNALKEDLVEFLNAGCDYVLTKPISPKFIIDTLKPYGIDLTQFGS